MNDVILFTFMIIMICAAIGCIYVVWIATLLTIELVKEWLEDNDIKGIFTKKRN